MAQILKAPTLKNAWIRKALTLDLSILKISQPPNFWNPQSLKVPKIREDLTQIPDIPKSLQNAQRPKSQ